MKQIEIPRKLQKLIRKLHQETHQEYLNARRHERCNVVLQLRNLGLLDSQIAQLLGVRQQAVSQWFQKRT